MNYKLCYIEGNFAYFTSLSLEEQTGPGWAKGAYETNADEPTNLEDIIIVSFRHPEYSVPGSYGRAVVSVDNINKQNVAWLSSDFAGDLKPIHAGTTLEEFVKQIIETDGEIFATLETWKLLGEKYE